MCVQAFTNVLKVIYVEGIFGKVDISPATPSGFSNGKPEASFLPQIPQAPGISMLDINIHFSNRTWLSSFLHINRKMVPLASEKLKAFLLQKPSNNVQPGLQCHD